ncbi:EamA family transporter RarD [Kineococcus sp. SYSU DK004]|uniref:EamA family transporter RarD n=1 Tax=Kineococcus sp. SYSU DK004 TaxID=3383125 RepID=UPI003D7E2534
MPSPAPSTPSPASPLAGADRTGVLAGFASYALWGAFPFYFAALVPAGAVEVLAHRVLWALLVCALVLTALRRWGPVVRVLRTPALLGPLSVAAVAIAVNWGVYAWAATTGHVLEAALGYFVNPLVTVLLGVLVLRERLRRAQWAAVGIGAVAVVVITADLGRLPWVALTLAGSFATYGLLKNRLARSPAGRVDALTGLSVETVVLALPAAAALAVIGAGGASTFTGHGALHTALMALLGVTTVVPLLLFAVAAGRVPLTLIGLLQYLTPVLQFLAGLALGERMPPSQWVGFALVWLALLVLTSDALRAASRGRRGARTGTAAEAPPAQ